MPDTNDLKKTEGLEIENINRRGIWLGTISIGIMAVMLAWIAVTLL